MVTQAPSDEPIAVVGLACRFPGALDPLGFWNNILADVDSVTPLPPERFHHPRYYDPQIGAYGKSYSAKGGLVANVPFDAALYRMPPKAVESTDIAHLWALDVARAALADAGYDPFGLTGKNVGVIVGHARGSMMTSDMAFGTAVEGLVATLSEAPRLKALGADKLLELQQKLVERIHARYPKRTEDGAIGSMTSALAGLIANSFGLTGRHMVVDAACASSFAALDIGINALRQGKLDAALVGGASYSQELSVVMFAQSRALSPDGSFPFDRRANGFISSDGFGLLLLRRLSDAVRDGNTIRAVIRAVGGSCDGKGKALWAPRKEGQVLAMKRAWQAAGLDLGSLGLLEAHATSTPLGDRTEIEALDEVFKAHRKSKLPIGSVKGNIGHSREAAGAAGLIKAILALEHGTLPPTGNFRHPSEEIPWDQVGVEVLTQPRPWNGFRRAGVNAFGIGGLNYHVIVEEAPPTKPRSEPRTKPALSAQPNRPEQLDIAIVGMGGRFPGANNVAAYWEKLLEGAQLFSEVPQDRWSSQIYYQPGERTPYRTYTKHGGFVTDFVADWRRYQVPPKLIERNDPLQFMLLESAMDALQDAKIDLERLDKPKVAVLVGSVFGSDYALELSLAIRAQELAEDVAAILADPTIEADALAALRQHLPSINEDSAGSFSSSTLASRTSKTLDLMGPAYALDAACASSLASLEAACELLRAGGADVVLYGGGDRAMRVQRYEAYCQFYALSRSSDPKPFDADADGFLPGEGAAVCALKRLEDAQRDQDPIYAVIRGIGSGTDGEKKSLYKPSAEGLARAMRRALDQAATDPERVRFVECHGGGTPAGDATEIEALRKVYPGKLTIGAVKGNLGHAQGAAGVFSLIKATLAQKRQKLPPSRLKRLNPELVDDPKLRVNTAAENLPPGLVAVSSMGLAGIDYHVLLESPESVAKPTQVSARPSKLPRVSKRPTGPRVFELGASDLESIQQVDADRLWSKHRLGEGPVRLYLTALSPPELDKALGVVRQVGLGPEAKELREKQGIFLAVPTQSRRLAFLFPGQGSQYPGMMRGFAADYPEVRALLAKADLWLLERGFDALGALMLSGAPIPAELFEVQASMLLGDLAVWTALLAEGIEPEWVTGHSYGDYAALVAAGAWSLQAALEATERRCEAIAEHCPPGAMTSVSASVGQVQTFLAGEVWIANVNAPDQVVIAGATDALLAAEARLQAAKLEYRRLEVPGPFHSPLMAAAKEALASALAALPLQRPQRAFLSSVTRRFETDPERIRQSLVDQLSLPVDFPAQLAALASAGANLWIEAGPKAVLTTLAKRGLPKNVAVIASDDPQRAGAWSMGRVQALMAAWSPTTESELMPRISLLEGEEAQKLLSDPSFAAFWEKTQPSLSSFLMNLWQAERQTLAPQAAPPAVVPVAMPDTQVPEVVSELPVPSESPATETIASTEEVQAFILDALCKESGYPPEIIQLDADLEADLGIDTVKQAQVLGKVRDRFDIRTDEKLSLRDFPTLRHVIDYVDRQLKGRAAPRQRRGVTVVDLTARRAEPAEEDPDPEPAPILRDPVSGLYTLPSPTVRHNPSEPWEVQILELKGTSREIGRQHAEALRDPILEVMERYQQFIGQAGMALLDLPDTTQRLRALFDRASQEELEGAAEVLGVHPLFLFAYNLDAALFPAIRGGCTQILRLAAENNGLMLHAVNEDSPLLLHLEGRCPRVVQKRRRTDGPDPDRTVLLFSMAGQIAGPNGTNTLGLSATSTTLLDGEAPLGIPDGTPHPQLVKRILEECATLSEAASILRASKKAGRWSLLMSDAQRDEALYLEYDGDRILLEDQQPRLSTNHALTGPAPGATVPEHSQHRQAQAQKLAQGPLEVAQAQALLRNCFDLGRNKAATFPTMNTVRRVDNVMSLVIEPKAQRLHLGDRVLPPGSRADADYGFRTIHYGNGSEVEDPRTWSSVGPGVVPVPEVMRRHLIRVVDAARPNQANPLILGPTLVVGQGPYADALVQVLRQRGAEVTTSTFEAIPDPRPFTTLALVPPVPGAPAWTLDAQAWARGRKLLLQTFALCRRWGRTTGNLLGFTFLGGGLGFENSIQGDGLQGGLVGLYKALRREFEGLRVQLLDLSPLEPPLLAAQTLLAEAERGDRLEVGLLRGKRRVLAMTEHPATFSEVPLPRSWLVTGGARGVTAKMALRLGQLYRPRLIVLGRQTIDQSTLTKLRPLDPDGLQSAKQDLLRQMQAAGNFTPLAWKARCEDWDKLLEIDANLEAIRRTGAEVSYHSVELSDRAALTTLLEAVGPFEGILHGAGVEVAKPFDKKSDALLEATLGGKLDGLVHLLHAATDSVKWVVGFSSVSGRFGGHGQADYALANEAMAHLLGEYRARNPHCRVASLSWAAFGEVGLAARSSARTFLEASGQAFMSPTEGANHLVRELWAGLPEPEVTICERMDALDLDQLLVKESQRARALKISESVARGPLLGRLIRRVPLTIERILSASEPFLDQHRLGGVPILPAVMALELLLELAHVEGGTWSLADLVIERPLKVPEHAQLTVRGTLENEALTLSATVTRADQVVLEPDRIFVRARRVPRQPLTSFSVATSGQSLRYPYPDRDTPLVYHGPVLRCVEQLYPGPQGGAAQLTVPSVVALVPGSQLEDWCAPVPLLDGCLQAAGLLGRLLTETVALPAGLGRIDLDPRVMHLTGPVRLAARFLGAQGDGLRWDLTVHDDQGPLVNLIDYRAQGLPK